VIRVVLVDDQALVRAGFRALLDAEHDMQVVGEAADGREAVEVVAAQLPDLVLMDIRMPRMDGIDATRRIAGDPACAAVRVVILTTFESDEYIVEGLRAGAAGFLVKDTEPVDLLRAIRVVTEGEALLSPSVTRRLIAEFVSGATPRAEVPGLETLTDRER
jgi:DNA-binding NarL/FixJ family response regulator